MRPRRRRCFVLALLALVFATLPGCEFLMDEFYTLQRNPPSLEDVLETQRGN